MIFAIGLRSMDAIIPVNFLVVRTAQYASTVINLEGVSPTLCTYWKRQPHILPFCCLFVIRFIPSPQHYYTTTLWYCIIIHGIPPKRLTVNLTFSISRMIPLTDWRCLSLKLFWWTRTSLTHSLSPLSYFSIAGDIIIKLAPQIVINHNAPDKIGQPLVMESYNFSVKDVFEAVSIDEYIMWVFLSLQPCFVLVSVLIVSHWIIQYTVLTSFVLPASSVPTSR